MVGGTIATGSASAASSASARNVTHSPPVLHTVGIAARQGTYSDAQVAESCREGFGIR
jgi:hypothetical protein